MVHVRPLVSSDEVDNVVENNQKKEKAELRVSQIMHVLDNGT